MSTDVASPAAETDAPLLDTTDVDRYVNQPLVGGQLKEAVTPTEIRRWVHAMGYPNPLHYDEKYAASSPLGQIVAPQSFTANCDVAQGSIPALVGNIPGSHVVLGGDEWWFYGPRILPGDLLRQERRFSGYTLGDTRFAGPSLFSQGDTLHRNQRGELVAKQRQTVVRYLAEEARKRGSLKPDTSPMPQWSAERLAEIGAQRKAWVLSRQGAEPLSWEAVEVGQQLITRPIGPHTVQAFANEWWACTSNVWGTTLEDDQDHYRELGWREEMWGDSGVAAADESLGTGLDDGPTRGHVDDEHAKLVGLSRMYGWGVSMGAWCLDYIAFWAGDNGTIRHSNIQYRFPPYEGNVSFLNGEVAAKQYDPRLGLGLVTVNVIMTNQDGAVTAKGPVDVELPT